MAEIFDIQKRFRKTGKDCEKRERFAIKQIISPLMGQISPSGASRGHLKRETARGLGYSQDAIDQIIAERKSAQAAAASAKVLARPGEIGNGRSRGADSTPIQRGSTDAEYLAARIKRDRPDIHERMKRGEFSSVRAAAQEAGLVKKEFRCVATVAPSFQVFPTP